MFSIRREVFISQLVVCVVKENSERYLAKSATSGSVRESTMTHKAALVIGTSRGDGNTWKMLQAANKNRLGFSCTRVPEDLVIADDALQKAREFLESKVG